jgi:conjugal transfer pilus assembly protein TraF
MNLRRLALLLLICNCGVRAEETFPDGYYQRKEQGWFWRELLPAPSEPNIEALPEPETQSPVEEAVIAPSPMAFSPEWMRENLPKYRDRALQEPTPENVRAYFYLQRHAMDMAERFALVAQKVVLADPSLDENTRRPISSYGGHVVDELARENTVRVAAKIATMAGVWYFYRSDCPYCAAQNPVLERLQRRIGLAVLPIALDDRAMPEGAFADFVPNRGHAQQLNVTQTPTLYLVRKPNEFVLLSEGLVTDDGLLERIVHAGHDAQWITDEEFNSTRATRPVDAPVHPQEVSEEILNDPVKLIEILQTRQAASRAVP